MWPKVYFWTCTKLSFNLLSSATIERERKGLLVSMLFCSLCWSWCSVSMICDMNDYFDFTQYNHNYCYTNLNCGMRWIIRHNILYNRTLFLCSIGGCLNRPLIIVFASLKNCVFFPRIVSETRSLWLSSHSIHIVRLTMNQMIIFVICIHVENNLN